MTTSVGGSEGCTIPHPISPPPGTFALPTLGRFFLDLFSGKNAPLFEACTILQVDAIAPLDIEFGFDILQDENFERILHAAWNGFLGGVWSAPPCREYSRLKLRPGGPPALRTPSEPEGRGDLSPLQVLHLQEQEEIHHRGRIILFAAHSRGAIVGWENPPSSMALLLEANTSMLRSWGATCSHVASCQWGMNFNKAWLMCSNDPAIASLASWCTCDTPHPSLAGKRTSTGAFVSSTTAEYPPALAMALVQILTTKCTGENQVLQWTQQLCRPTTVSQCKHINDGGGIPSSADWTQPHQLDFFQTWRQRILEYGRSHDQIDRLCQNLQAGSEVCPLSADDLNPLKQLTHHWLAEQGHSADWHIATGQNFRLNLLQSLVDITQDPDQGLIPYLQQGVPTGALSDMPRSYIWPPKHNEVSTPPELEVCSKNWKGADDNPTLTLQLIEEEITNGWVDEIKGGLEEARQRWQNIAVGKLNVVHSTGRKPRLVLDSSCCGVNHRCALPETMILPTVDDVRNSFDTTDIGGSWLGFSLDIKAAHKQIRLHPDEQGLVIFSFQGRFFHYKVAHFGGRFSAFWWSRLGALLLRLLHRALHWPHRAWLYVDDLFLLSPCNNFKDTIWMTVVFFSLLNTPISWKKTQMGRHITWIGWEFDLFLSTVNLVSDKSERLTESIQELLHQKQVNGEQLERLLGLLIWFTSIAKHLRPHLAPIYKCLYSPPATLFSVPAGVWPQFVNCLDQKAVIVKQHPHLHFPVGGRIVEMGHQKVIDKCDLPLAPKTSKLQWVRIAGPQQAAFQLSKEAKQKLQWFLRILHQSRHTYPIVQPQPLMLRSAADAFAEGNAFGVGGWIITSQAVGWFSEQWNMDQLKVFKPDLTKDAQKYISAFEILAQLVLLMTGCHTIKCSALEICIPSSSDNTSAESSVNRQLSTKEPASTFLQLMSEFAMQKHVRLLVTHIPGHLNDWADNLSRDKLSQWLHYPRFRVTLSDIFAIGQQVTLHPPGDHPDWLTKLTYPVENRQISPACIASCLFFLTLG